MIVTAQKKSSDPVQQSLRERKARWNKKVSEFIDDLIHLKKMMNGWPSKFLMERSRITDPIPKDPATILGVLGKDFVEIVNEGNDIIAAQIAYSQTRRKKRPKQPAASPETPVSPDLTKQLSLPLSASVEMAELISVGSNPLTRFLSTLRGPRFGNSAAAIKRRARISLLTSAHQIYKLCSKFQSNIVKFKSFSDDFEGLEEANSILIEIENRWNEMFQSLQVAAKKLEDMEPKPNVVEKSPERTSGGASEVTPIGTREIPLAAPSKSTESIANRIIQEVDTKIIPDWQKASTLFLDMDQSMRVEIISLLDKYLNTDNAKMKTILAEQIVSTYNAILMGLNSVRNTNATSLSEIAELSAIAFEDYSGSGLEVQADYLLSKMHGKLLRSIITRKTNSSRLLAYNYAEDMRKGLDEFMNELEKDFIPDKLTELLSERIIKPYFVMKESLESILSTMQLDTSNLPLDQKTRLDKLIMSRKNRQLAERLVPRITFPVDTSR